MEINIGTRKSKLALWQAEYVKNKLEENGIKATLFPIDTKGDKILDKSIAKIGSKGVFTEELEEKLRNKEIDIAVHSAKDMQSRLPDEFEIIAFTDREESGDVLVSRKRIDPNDTSLSFTAGTSSVRRRALLRYYFPHIKLADMRGNLQTRIKKMDNGDCDALLLAKAGVIRMGYEDMIVHEFDQNIFVPPVGQGCLAIEAATALDSDKKDILRKILNNNDIEKIMLAERKFLNILEGGCSIPAFCHGNIVNDKVCLKGGVVDPKGGKIVVWETSSAADAPENAGKELADYVLKNGGKEILDSLK